MRKLLTIMPMAAAFLLAASVSAHAGTYSFDFNALGTGVLATGGTTATSSIQNYMNNVICGSWNCGAVTVSSGALSNKGYTGDGHVVGATQTSPLTLGTSDGTGAARTSLGCTTGSTADCNGTGLDTFIRNDPSVSSFYFAFTNGITITSVSFDYEIFPDATCQQLNTTNCGAYNSTTGTYANQPDFTFSQTTTANVTTPLFHFYALKPNAGQLQPAGSFTTGSAGSGSEPYLNSQMSTNELTPQLIGTGTWNMTGAVNKLTFADWPATIGIDNLTVNYNNAAPVPEPGSMILLGSGLAGLYARRKKRKATV